jgi:LysR family transcriptional regulator, chromosome initiation inhibitor
MQFDLEQLRTLSAAVEQGTLDAAAAALHITPSAVSQRLRALETTVGQVLLERSRPVRATQAGEAVLRLARQVELLTADTATELAGGEAQALPRLGIAVNADSLATWFLPALAPLAGRLAVELYREDEANTAGLLRAGRVVAAITYDPKPISGCTTISLGAMRYRPMAAPAFAERWFPDGATPAALEQAPMMVFDRDDPLQHNYLTARAPGADPPQTMVPSSTEFVTAIGFGLGWGMVADLQRPTGPELVELEPGAEVDVPLHLQHWRLRTPSLERLAAAIVAGARQRLG